MIYNINLNILAFDCLPNFYSYVNLAVPFMQLWRGDFDDVTKSDLLNPFHGRHISSVVMALFFVISIRRSNNKITTANLYLNREKFKCYKVVAYTTLVSAIPGDTG